MANRINFYFCRVGTIDYSMHIYRFRIQFEDQDEFLRELEIRSDQTFEDFYLTLVGNLKLDSGTLSSFFIADHQFRKRQEISYLNMNPESSEEGGKPVPIMRDCFLKDYVDDPHQKLLLVYDYLNYWTFYIELIKIMQANSQHTYPRISRSEGDTPRELTSAPGAIPIEDRHADFSFEEEVYDPDDLDHLSEDEDFGEEPPDNLNGFEEESF